MRVLRAEAMGFCFGVRDALDAAASVDAPEQVTIHGELVHNPLVLHQLNERGFTVSSEQDRPVPQTPRVLITAHGISDRERERLERAGRELIDTTCPLVLRVHRAAATFARSGFHVVVVGRPGHVEVRGIVEDLAEFDVCPDVASVVDFGRERLGVVCQTTMPPDLVETIRDEISRRNPRAEIRFVNTVCQPTLDRQAAVDRLAQRAELIVVVGGRNSNNTGQLVRRVEQLGCRAVHIEKADELRPEWFTGIGAVGLTAGTSTPESVIDQVHAALAAIATRESSSGASQVSARAS